MTAGLAVLVALSVLLFVGAIVMLLFFCRRIQVQRERESLVFIQEPTDVYREELNDSFMEQALWRCGVCKFLNHPERKLCDLCQTLRGAERDVAGNKKHSRSSFSRGSLSSSSTQRMGRIGETEAFSSSQADDAIGGSFRRPSFEFSRKPKSSNKMSKLQLAASRRQQWKRMPTTDGLHRSELIMNLEGVHNLPFPDKIRWFSTEIHRLWLPWESGHAELVVRRDHLLQDSFELVAAMKPYQLRQRWRVVFDGEPALDAGGVMREWFTLLFAELFDPSFGLFVSTVGDERSYWINASSDLLLGEEEHLAYFEFAGRLVGKAILEEHLMPVHLALPFLKHILGVPISFSDLQFLDDEIYNSALMVKKIDDIEPLCLDFTATRIVDGKPEIVELVEGGADIDVTRENRSRYLDALFKYHVLGSVSDQLLSFLTALYDVVPEGLLKLFDYQELELLMCGVPSIDVEDWKKHTDFKFFTHNFPTELELNNIEWFWEVVEDMRNEDRVRLLQFATGTSRVPAQGFKGLISSDGRVRRFNVAFAGANQSFLFPKAHTCFNRLDLPIYNSKEVLAQYVNLIVQMDITGFTIE
ncbi:HECT E3 ubiquitin ligase, putative [Phytophthora infestans T30-4]|uniref:HECT-type E3 ubiquitin transferase n=1 Tax=Phytophthora infestans (strain T30-4) TaxID=403677 RepID=D0RLT4_PHYIT|nr:HECT E3 ubiquitin ligase, putative [Phytophthora infestans T30-4]EEY70195.1 HECT E3 ubiquitin ligase, putative [Phytophthora infestans T30-4]|eukprot:XP_002999325.1 HECT E3 ubiquitin ligase, putative [Phytophthora infestans T30-4]